MAKDPSGKEIKAGRLGDLQEVKNIDPKLNAKETYCHIRVQDKTGKEFSLLLTEHEVKAAIKRAQNNPEDLPEVGWLRDLLD